MKNLPDEIISRITEFIEKHAKFENQDDVPLHLRPKPESPLPAYATISHAWRHAIERRTFRRLRIRSTDLDDFAQICVGHRRSILSVLTFEIILPIYSDGACALVKTTSDRSANDAAFTDAVHNLFRVLKSWEVDEITSRRGRLLLIVDHMYSPKDVSQRGVVGQLQQQQQVIGTVRDIGHVRYKHSNVRLLQAEQLPDLSCVTRFSGNLGTVYERKIAPKSFGEICAKFPRLEMLSWTLNDTEKEHIRQSRRQDCAEALTSHNYYGLKEANMILDNAAPNNHHVIPPNVIQPMAYDLLSSALRKLSITETLTSLTIEGVIDASLFWPSEAEADKMPQWPTLKHFDVEFCICAPSGEWYFDVDPSASSDDEDINNAGPDQDLRLAGRLSVNRFRSIPNPSTLSPLLEAMAKCAAHMPALERITLDTYLDSIKCKWSVAYYAPGQINYLIGNDELDEVIPKRCLYWEVGHWHPDNNIPSLWERVQEESGVEFCEKFI